MQPGVKSLRFQTEPLPKRLIAEGVLAFRSDFLALMDVIAADVEAIANEPVTKASCRTGNNPCGGDACCPHETAGGPTGEREVPAAA